MRFRATFRLILLALATGCATGLALEGLDQEGLYELGMQKFADEEWSDAIAVFERFALTFPQDPRVPEVRYHIGAAYMNRREYVTAAAEFNRLATEYPAGPWSDDARMGICRAYYNLSPPPPRDQEYTESGIDHCRALIAYYPESEFVSEATDKVNVLVNRLAEKEYDTAELYFRRRAFHSANVYYEWVVDTYPETTWAPRALLRLSESYTRLGYEQEAEAAKQRLLREFPTSPQAKQISGATASTRR